MVNAERNNVQYDDPHKNDGGITLQRFKLYNLRVCSIVRAEDGKVVVKTTASLPLVQI